MPYTDNPETNPADRVRFLVQDTKEPYKITDAEILYLLSEQGDSAQRAAARGAEVLAAFYAGGAEEKQVGPLRLKFTELSRRYTVLARSLWARASRASATPYAGGISRADKITRAQDLDRVRPIFYRKMQAYPNTGAPQTGSEELLSPPEMLP